MSKIKILIVEDEVIVALDIKNTVIKLGYTITDTVTNCKDAIESIQANIPDLILMDINLQNSKDGIETVKMILDIKNIPVVYLTAYSDDYTIERAAKTNPVGYIVKPFKRNDIKVTLKLAIIKSKNIVIKNSNNTFTDLGFNYYFDTQNDYLYYGEELIKISQNEAKLLTLLIGARGNLVPTRQIEYEIWTEPVTDTSLRTLVHRLRSKFDHKIIENVHALGFKLILNNNDK